MCVTANPAVIVGTQTYVYATYSDEAKTVPVHVSGYQNEAQTFGVPNCMFLNFAGQNLSLVRGPEHTSSFMNDMTYRLPELEFAFRSRGGESYGTTKGGFWVEEYGDYTIILAQKPGDILSMLEEVPLARRPLRTRQLEEMISFYMAFYPEDSFVLACFDGKVKPKHPITVSYTPRNPSVLTIPGLDGHDGRVPVIGSPVHRDFRVAFGIEGITLPFTVTYRDGVKGKLWAPSSVSGFRDNRHVGPNGDYVVPTEAVAAGLTGVDLALLLQ